MECPVCGTSLRLAVLRSGDPTPTPEPEATREEWTDAEQKALLREAAHTPTTAHPAGSAIRRHPRAGKGGDGREHDERDWS